jgi:hypothetical protein
MYKRILFFMSVIPLILVACSAASSPTQPELQGEGVGGSRVAGIPMEAPAVEEPAADSLAKFQGQTGTTIDRIVIKNASLDIIVEKPPEVMDAIGKMAEDMGGFIVSANLYQTRLASGEEVPRASITIRVPADRLDEAMGRIEGQSDRPVENKTINSQDVTQEYTDLQSRLKNLEATETQLVKIMEEANKTEDVLRVYNEITRVREEIEVTKGRIQYFDQSARLSSISVNILPREAVQPLSVGGWQPVGVARDAVQALINGLQWLVNVVIWLGLFIIPILLVIILPLYLIVRALLRWRARRKDSKAAQAAT